MQIASYKLVDEQEGLLNASVKIEPLRDDNATPLSRFTFYNESNNIFAAILEESLFTKNDRNPICFILITSNPINPSIHSISCSIHFLKHVLCISPKSNTRIVTNAANKPLLYNKIWNGIFKCDTNVYISVNNLCDGIVDCQGGANDEQNCTCKTSDLIINDSVYCSQICHPSNCTCPRMYMQKVAGGCQLYIHFSNIYTFKTNSKSNKPAELLPELFDPTKSKQLHKGSYHCPKGMNNCFSGLKECYSHHNMCQYHIDTNTGLLSICTNGKHLEHCEQFVCSYSFKCQSSYCIPHKYICNGKWDCWDGSDEVSCASRSCSNLFKCKHSTICFPLDLVCNYMIDCPDADDECCCQSCLQGCTCLGQAILCLYTTFRIANMISFSAFLSVTISQSQLPYHIGFHRAVKISIFETHLTEFWQVIMVGNYSYLHSIDMTFDKMKEIKMHSPNTHLMSLKYLNLSNNVIYSISNYAFSSLSFLLYLDLSNNNLSLLSVHSFDGLCALRLLNIFGNSLYKVFFFFFFVFGKCTDSRTAFYYKMLHRSSFSFQTAQKT